MKTNHKREQLLAEVLDETEASGFKEQLLVETLGWVRRRRHLRRARRVSAGFVMIILLAVFAWRFVGVGVGAESGVVYVTSIPFEESRIVRTRPLNEGATVSTVASIELISTKPGAELYRRITGDELLALVSPRPAALVRLGPETEALVFLASAETN